MPAIKISALFERMKNWQNFAAHFYNYKICDELPAGSFLRTVHCEIVERWALGRIIFPDLDDL